MHNAVYFTFINKMILFKSYFFLFFSTVINIVSLTIYPNDTVSFLFYQYIAMYNHLSRLSWL